MSDNETLIKGFYEAFARKDPEAMGACYHDEATFGDPVFPDLSAKEARAMWLMLCMSGQDLEVEHSEIKADEKAGTAHWEARYTFSPTGRKVHNVIDASFEFKDGLITKHRDSFDLWAWTRMALGLPGLLGGWTPIVRNQVRSQAAKQLEKFIKVTDENVS